MTNQEAIVLAQSAVEAMRVGWYAGPDQAPVDWTADLRRALCGKVSLPPDAPLLVKVPRIRWRTDVTVTAERTLEAARRLHEAGKRVVALNFANGLRPGGGFLHGALAQEESLCRCSALYAVLADDPMYAHHQILGSPEASDWVIYTPNVPVFRMDDGTPLVRPWLLALITAAAPYAPDIGQPLASNLLKRRILRVLTVAQAYGHQTLVLGAWGCGAFGHDPHQTATDFRDSLGGPFAGVFQEIVFAISDSTYDKRIIGPFRETFGGCSIDD